MTPRIHVESPGLDAIILFSHGSVLCGAERSLLDLARRMRGRDDAGIVEVGFLNYNEPSFPTAVQRCVDQGATRILIAPYFLIAGRFVVRDLPEEIERSRAQHPEITFVTAGVIGFHPALAEAVLASASAARPPAEWLEAWAGAAELCRDDPKCPMHGHPLCRASAGAQA